MYRTCAGACPMFCWKVTGSRWAYEAAVRLLDAAKDKDVASETILAMASIFVRADIVVSFGGTAFSIRDAAAALLFAEVRHLRKLVVTIGEYRVINGEYSLEGIGNTGRVAERKRLFPLLGAKVY